jgi:hypothetical protein
MRGPTPTSQGGSSPATPPPGVCGPDVTTQLVSILRRIQADFKGSTWTKDDRQRACRRILIPLKMPVWTPGTNLRDFGRSATPLGFVILDCLHLVVQHLRHQIRVLTNLMMCMKIL